MKTEMTLEEMQDLHLCGVNDKTRTEILQEVQDAKKNWARGTMLYIEDKEERNAFKSYFLDLDYMLRNWLDEADSPSFEVRWTY